MKRILVFGNGGSGKSTLSRQLEKILNIKVYHLDTYKWKPGLIENSDEEWNKSVNEILSREEWILDGNYRRIINERIALADTIFVLDMPILLCLYRVLKRRIIKRKMIYKKSSSEIKKWHSKKLGWSYVKWIINFKRAKAPEIAENLKPYEGEKDIIVFKYNYQVKRYIKTLEKKYSN